MEQTSAPSSKQQERAERILDAAAELLLRWGYRRVTIDDIARQAEIGTGTVYLHWKTRDTLFQTLLLREAVAVWRELLQHIRSHHNEVRLSRIMRHLLLTVMQRPLARAMFTGDQEMLGKLVTKRGGAMQQAQQMAATGEFYPLVLELGLLRSDIDLDELSYAFGATLYGFIQAESILPIPDQLTLERKADALARTLHDAFEPANPPSQEALQEAVNRIAPLLEGACEQSEQIIRTQSKM